MGATYVPIKIRAIPGGGVTYKADFLVDTGAIECLAPASELEKIGVERVGSKKYELADGQIVKSDYGIALIEMMDEITAGRIVFGPEVSEPIVGLVVMESIGVKVNPVTKELEKLPAGMLK